MERHYGACGWSDRGLGVRRIQVQVAGADDVAKHRTRARVPNRVRGRDEVEGGEDHLVAWAAARGEQREMKGGGAAGNGDRVSAAAERCKLLLERGDPRSHAPPAGR